MNIRVTFKIRNFDIGNILIIEGIENEIVTIKTIVSDNFTYKLVNVNNVIKRKRIESHDTSISEYMPRISNHGHQLCSKLRGNHPSAYRLIKCELLLLKV